jgi:hypothetical protein
VVTDLHGVTGRDIMDHLIAGERNPKLGALGFEVTLCRIPGSEPQPDGPGNTQAA